MNPDAADDPVLVDMLTSPCTPLEMARRHGLTLTELSDWIDDDRTRRTLSNLRLFADLQAQMTLSQFRYLVALKLIKLTNQPQASPELLRRVCMDVLKIDVLSAQWPAEDAGESITLTAFAGD